jgi:Secretion system C-terminal sorting domain
VTVTSNESCTGSALVLVTVLPQPWLAMGNTDNTMSVAAEPKTLLTEDDGLRVYPNPADAFLQIEWPESQMEKQAEIFTVEGKSVRRFSLPPDLGRQEVLVGDLPAGFYFLKAEGWNKPSYFMKK